MLCLYRVHSCYCMRQMPADESGAWLSILLVRSVLLGAYASSMYCTFNTPFQPPLASSQQLDDLVAQGLQVLDCQDLGVHITTHAIGQTRRLVLVQCSACDRARYALLPAEISQVVRACLQSFNVSNTVPEGFMDRARFQLGRLGVRSIPD